MAFWRKKEGRKPREVFCLFIKKGGKILERKSKRKNQVIFLKWKLITFGSCVCIGVHPSLPPPRPPKTVNSITNVQEAPSNVTTADLIGHFPFFIQMPSTGVLSQLF